MSPPRGQAQRSHDRLRRRRGALFALALALGAYTAPELNATESTIAGVWILNEDLSDDIEDSIDGKMRKSRYTGGGPEFAERETGQETTDEMAQREYWQSVRSSRERRSKKDLRRLGSAYPLLTAERISVEDKRGAYEFLYDDKLPRRVRPNPEGRAYSASGDELVSDSIGHTLSFWDEADLVLETDPPNGGKYIERVTLVGDPGHLEYSIELRVRALTETVVIKRVFEREPTTSKLR